MQALNCGAVLLPPPPPLLAEALGAGLAFVVGFWPHPASRSAAAPATAAIFVA